MPSRLKEVTMEHIPNITSDVIECQQHDYDVEET
jgi:hypothetical protein